MVFFLDYPIQYAVRIWDLFLFYGFDILIFVSVASIVCFEGKETERNGAERYRCHTISQFYFLDEILKKDFEECMKFVNHLEDHIIKVPIDTLLRKVQSFWLKGHSRLKQLRLKYSKSHPQNTNGSPK